MARQHWIFALAALTAAGCYSTAEDTAAGMHVRSMRYLGDPDVVGTLEGPAVDAALAEASESLESCLALSTHVDEVIVWLDVEEDGIVAGLSPGVGAELPVPVAFCLQEAVADLNLPEPEGGMASVAVALKR